ncbi:MAG: hypothetical protein OES32_06525 [Acidobacteriota bacterium]|nr:hypothetical protein [Acidobacteriota bacterium]
MDGAVDLGRKVAGAVAALLLASAIGAQEGEPPAPPPPAPPPPAAVPASPERENLLPNLDFYFPEGELDFRLHTLVKGSFYEGQLRYNFVKGDIQAFLRYRYYARKNVYQLGLFDTIEIDPIEKGSNDFERTRGGLFLVNRPVNHDNRFFFLGEVDRTSSSKEELLFTTNRTNTFVRLGYQLGTPDDVRLNSIVGETRAQRRNLFTAHRKIGPGGAGFSAAVTWGFEALLGDFDFVKLELAGLKRFHLGDEAFIVLRAHGGTFPRKVAVRPEEDFDSPDRYSIPRGELFRLDGRDNLKGLKGSRRGTEELHATFELFLPWFLGANRRAFNADWDSWYWILYGGYGAIGFDRAVLGDASNYIADAGVGFETSLRLKGYTLFIAGIVARTFDADAAFQARFDIKALH